MIFGCFYRSPTESPYSHSNNAKLNELIIQLALSNRYTHCCFVGDFNFGEINWSNCSSPCSEESKEEKFLEALRDSYLFQHVREPTRSRGKDEPSTLDLILTNEENQISNLEYNAPLGKSDHSTLYFVYDCYINTNSIKDRFQFDKADYVSMIEDLEERRKHTDCKYTISKRNLGYIERLNHKFAKLLRSKKRLVLTRGTLKEKFLLIIISVNY